MPQEGEKRPEADKEADVYVFSLEMARKKLDALSSEEVAAMWKEHWGMDRHLYHGFTGHPDVEYEEEGLEESDSDGSGPEVSSSRQQQQQQQALVESGAGATSRDTLFPPDRNVEPLTSGPVHVPSLHQNLQAMTEQRTRRIGQIIRLKPSALAEYKEYHAKIWPEVAAQIRDSNISDYSIFLDERSMTLFASFKWTGSDWEVDMKRMKENVQVQAWWKIMDSYQESFNENATGSTGDIPWWFDLEEVFRLE